MTKLQVGQNIKRIRKEQGLTFRELATLAEVGSTTLFDIEKGNTSPTINTLESIAKGLGVRIEDLLGNHHAQNLKVTFSREKFKKLSELLLYESFKDNNNILIFTQNNLIKFGIHITKINTIAEFEAEQESD